MKGLQGNLKEIEIWREEKATENTEIRRPNLSKNKKE